MIKCKFFLTDLLEIGDCLSEQHSFDDTNFDFSIEKISDFLYNGHLSIYIDSLSYYFHIFSSPLESVVLFINDNIDKYVKLK